MTLPYKEFQQNDKLKFELNRQIFMNQFFISQIKYTAKPL